MAYPISGSWIPIPEADLLRSSIIPESLEPKLISVALFKEGVQGCVCGILYIIKM
jgi:hypothetical protein